MKQIIVSIMFIFIYFGLYGENGLNNYVIDRHVKDDGTEVIGINVPGGKPPEGYVRKDIVDIESLKTNRNIVIIDDVPAFDWSYGCSATSAAMVAAYYDRNGYPNIYTGPTNGGVMPLDNSTWNESSGGEGGDGECPLSATHLGFDGLTTRGHVDNYWTEYGSEAQDPYITNGWTPHTNANCTGDFMGTNQSYWGNTDGGTTFYTNNDGSALDSFSECESFDPPRKDGSYGFEQFMESRGYNVSACYNQRIAGYDNIANGFTFADFMTEINANRPVLIHVVGHTMVGFGYDSSNQTIYIKNTWDYSTHTMIWGGDYSDMTHYAVTILNLESDNVVTTGDNFNNAFQVNTLPYTANGNTTYYTNTLGNDSNDVFYRIYLPYPANDVIINTNGSDFDTYLRVYNSSQTLLYTDDDGGEGVCSQLSDLYLAPYTEYYVCVEGYSSNNGNYSLNISLEGQETLTLECNDSYGDGWNGNSVSVFVNGYNVVQNFTFTNGSQATRSFGVLAGNSVATTFNTGSYPSECSYRILDSNGTELANGDDTNNIYFIYGETGSAPTNLSASVVNDNDVVLNWSAPGVVIPDDITEGFEESFPPSGWNTTVTNTTQSWARYETASFTSGDVVPTEGSYQAGVMWDYSAQDEWLVTPAISNVTSLSFDFYGQYGSVNGDNYYVKVSTDGGNSWTPIWNATDLPEAENHYDTPVNIDLSAYASENIKIAWNFVDSDGAGLWYATYIDNIIFSNNGRAVAFDSSELKTFSKAEKVLSTTKMAKNRLSKDPNYVSHRSTRNLTNYKIYRNGVELATVADNVLTYIDTDLYFNNYDYYVTAVYSQGESTASNTVAVSIIAPELHSPPANLTATTQDSYVDLSWDAPLDLPVGTWITKGAEDNNDGIGTGSAATFAFAHMYTETELSMYRGMYINSIKIFPREASATYTLKVWGGADGNTQLYSQGISEFTNEAWNQYNLNSTVAIPTSGPLYIGYYVNTTTGYPGGCDAGPAVTGGDMIKMNDQADWNVLSQITTIDANWNIQAFVSADGEERVAMTPITKSNNAVQVKAKTSTASKSNHSKIIAGNLGAIVAGRHNLDRALTSYKVYRDNVEIAEVGPAIHGFTDLDLENGNYIYHTTAMYAGIESIASNSVAVNVNYINPDLVYQVSDDFESYTNFSLTADPWIFTDIDNSSTYTVTNTEFPNAGSAMAYIVFNPGQTTPALTGGDAHSGDKYLACFASTVPNNNDWLISPLLEVGSFGDVSFWLKSFTTQYGMERFNVLISTGSTDVADFTQISTGTYTEVSDAWTEFSYNLDDYLNQNIRIAIQCVSSDAFVFMVDDFTFTTSNDITDHTNLTGQLVDQSNDNIGLEGQISLEGSEDFVVLTDPNGYFIIENIPKYEIFTLTADALGHQTYTTEFEATNSNLDIGTIGLLELTEAPTNVTAEINGDIVNINWNAPMGRRTNSQLVLNRQKVSKHTSLMLNKPNENMDRNLIGYYVYRFLASNASNQAAWSLLNNVITTNLDYADTNTSTLNDTYQYAVKAVYSGNIMSEAELSNSIEIINDTIAPPEDLTAIVAGQNVTLNWSAPAREMRQGLSKNLSSSNNRKDVTSRQLISYSIYRNNSQISSVASDVVTFTDINLAFASYEYYVTAVFSLEESVSSNVVSVIIEELTPPTNLTASVDNNDVTLSWSVASREEVSKSLKLASHKEKNDRALTAYNIYRNDTFIASVDSSILTYLDADLEYDSYEYYVTAIYTNGESAASNVINLTLVEPDQILPPTNLTATMYDDNNVTLAWSAPVRVIERDLINYKIYRDDTLIQTVTSDIFTYNDEDLDYITYEYYVTALYTESESEASNTVTITLVEPEEILPPTNLTATVSYEDITLSWSAPTRILNRDLTNYKIYRDEVEIAEVTSSILTYMDSDLSNGYYSYYVTAMYDEVESETSNMITSHVHVINSDDIVISDSFEEYDDFALEFGDWTLVDEDLSTTYTINETEFLNGGSAMSYIVFNPAMTVPAIDNASYDALDGSKYIASFAAITAPNNDWIISQPFSVGDEGEVIFSAKSITDQYGLERFNVLVSDGSTEPNDFTSISGNSYTEAPTDWTYFYYNLEDYANQTIRIAIQCESDDAFSFMLDDITIVSPGGTDNNYTTVPELTTSLCSNYPNPFNPETTISYSVGKTGNVTLEVYNILGQKVRTLVNETINKGAHSVVWNGKDDAGKAVASGVYFYSMQNGTYIQTNKMILMK
jgi:hypothetical protein